MYISVKHLTFQEETSFSSFNLYFKEGCNGHFYYLKMGIYLRYKLYTEWPMSILISCLGDKKDDKKRI